MDLNIQIKKAETTIGVTQYPKTHKAYGVDLLYLITFNPLKSSYLQKW